MKSFKDQLNAYMDMINCSASALSEKSGLSASTISRYRSGAREPEKNSTVISDLAKAIVNLAKEKNIVMSFEEIENTLNACLENKGAQYPFLAEHLDLLVTTLQINMTNMAKHMNFDASYLSRIRTGQRTPANAERFVDDVCRYVLRKYSDMHSMELVASMIECEREELTVQTYYDLLSKWFCGSSLKKANQMENFLKKLDEFDLNEYIRAIHFDELKVFSVPLRLPTSKNYYGIEQMKQGELDFFKATVLAKSMEPVFMCSDMPMADMAKDLDFGKKWMFAIAMSLKKGLHLNIIHNINRPFDEMMLGLESWIPIYMTGQVSPYHLSNVSTNVYHHINYVSGTIALSGECVDGHYGNGKYYLTNNKDEMAYYKQKASDLLSKAQPLMDIYTEETKAKFVKWREQSANESGDRHNMLSSLPIYTLSDELLSRILAKTDMDASKKQVILDYAKREREFTEQVLSNHKIFDEVMDISREEFEGHPMLLSLAGVFYEIEIPYTYEEYQAHLKLTKEFEKQHANYKMRLSGTLAFRNIQVRIVEEKYVVISKVKAPVIHFVIRHEKMVQAIANFVPIAREM